MNAKNSINIGFGVAALGVGAIYFLAGVAWPVLHVVGRTYEPEILVIPFVIGIPAFLLTHIFAAISIYSNRPEKSLGGLALKILWITIPAFIAVCVLLVTLLGSKPIRDAKPDPAEIAGEYEHRLHDEARSILTISADGTINGTSWELVAPGMTPSGAWSIHFDGAFLSCYRNRKGQIELRGKDEIFRRISE